ncbi:A24 family peptidase [Thermoleptolyngbya sp. M55_K2018_002]|uniref:prepilin peptidase n=1 Tax=Thermoleptolyngbya sp. M55_K2018_002 TaxID=2747808 RepID=UPI0019DFF7DF|nr:A24 family peptidase [Thermoleptolyngbya sp. M55_K2018_002]HIK42986.1 prepilin peptidase [Thermoleptolyngbya sp. M55_K2018_002]
MELILEGLRALIVFLIGASVGSFLNVVVYRIPAGLSLLHPPSRCPSCLTPIRPYDNVPVLGWLWLGGQCRTCKASISPRYPLVELITGLLFVAVAQSFALPLPAVGYWALVSWLMALALIDLDTLTLPNVLTQSGLVAGLIFQAAMGWSQGVATGQGGLMGSAAAVMGGVVGAVLGIWGLDLITFVGSVALGQTAMGGGDAKLAAMMGAWLGWKLLLLAGFLACVLGAFVGGGAIALGLLSRRQPIPFGPFLALGAILAVFFGESLIRGYLGFFWGIVQ